MAPKSARNILLAAAFFAFLGGGFWLHALLMSPPPAGGSAPAGPANTTEALQSAFVSVAERVRPAVVHIGTGQVADRKSTRLNSSHDQISYAVFCLKKKKP